jgi:hypothetical protein
MDPMPSGESRVRWMIHAETREGLGRVQHQNLKFKAVVFRVRAAPAGRRTKHHPFRAVRRSLRGTALLAAGYTMSKTDRPRRGRRRDAPVGPRCGQSAEYRNI